MTASTQIRMILVTGWAGTGKSTLLARARQCYADGGEKLLVIDSLLPWDTVQLTSEEASSYAAVAIDEVTRLFRPDAVVADALAWCKKHGKLLWLTTYRRADLEALGVTLPHETLEIHLDLERVDKGFIHSVTLVHGTATRKLTSLQELLSLIPVPQQAAVTAPVTEQPAQGAHA